MEFVSIARIYRSPDDTVSLRDVWVIGDGELSGAADIAWKYVLSKKELADLHREVAWSAQALIEFIDLANFTPPVKGRWQHKNYLYFEAVSALREATVGILNGLPRASMGLLRSILEMLLLHCWWQERISRKGSSVHFYDWLNGQRGKPKFANIVQNNFEFLEIPADVEAIEQVNRTYERLCSYVHAPILKESITTLNQGNLGLKDMSVLRHWFVLARDVLRIALEHLVHLYPQSLFPVDITRKFGFSPPVGMYFDRHNFIPLMAVFGKTQIEIYRKRLRDRELVESAMKFYESRPDLTREQILETWNNEDNEEAADDLTGDLQALWFRVKAQMRVTSMVLSYAEPLHPNW